MQLVLDSNEYLFAFGVERKPSCQILLRHIVSNPKKFRIRVSRTILEEIQRNTAAQPFKDIWVFLRTLGVSVDENWEVPFELGVKYEALGLKPGDAFIAAYADWAGVEFLITENRDFRELHSLPFRVIRAEEFLKEH